jgi:hypothetical protein
MLENVVASYPTAPLLKYSGYNPPHKIIMKGMMSLQQFLKFINISELEFQKGKGRAFCGTSVGTVFMADKCDRSKQMYITVAGPNLKTKSGESLEGTLWLVNSTVQLYAVVK